MSAELTDFCFDPSDLLADFEATLAAEEGPTSCEYDCAHLWCVLILFCPLFLSMWHCKSVS